MALSVLPLHKHQEYLNDCCDLINDEWKRSKTARLHSLQNSCDNLPTSLILLEEKKLVGHLKLSVIPSKKNACFVESVVIERSHRGKGYGTVLMKEAEAYCKLTLGLDTVYLSTRGQEEFYVKLGYIECMPVSIYGNYVFSNAAPLPVSDNNSIIKTCVTGNIPLPPPLPIFKNVKEKIFMKKAL
ncbi:N-alpha-acetyltransferase 80 [Leptinotarsa decemlineata]|uniref:N-alpha-acetyltransferase 80 n=1 Tax=Leptinotarsa decemlineata TaxID=7539 RepID=UPI003D30A93E